MFAIDVDLTRLALTSFDSVDLDERRDPWGGGEKGAEKG